MAEAFSFTISSGLAVSGETDLAEAKASAASEALSPFGFLLRVAVRLGLGVTAAVPSEDSETLSSESTAAAREELADLRLSFFTAGAS